jgi:hypothetical protein
MLILESNDISTVDDLVDLVHDEYWKRVTSKIGETEPIHTCRFASKKRELPEDSEWHIVVSPTVQMPSEASSLAIDNRTLHGSATIHFSSLKAL